MGGVRELSFVKHRLGNVHLTRIRSDPQGDHWLHVVGKGSKAAKVALPPLARCALDRHLAERGLPQGQPAACLNFDHVDLFAG